MREILFRGKRAKNKEWIYGSVLVERDYPGTVIVTKENHNVVTKADVYYFDVIPETVGQCTGLTDKNGKRIFEGDIVRNGGDNILLVGWSNNDASFVLCPKPYSSIFFYNVRISQLEVIGNKFDNPELLGGKENG